MLRPISWRLAFSRGLAAFTAVVVLLTLRPAHSSPGEIFSTAAPAISDTPQATTGIADGESGVSTSTGAFTYSFPVGVPPGRGGMQPSISLQYSSQAPVYGTLATGWALSGLPMITEDSSGGRLWGTAQVPTAKRYQSSLSGNRPLIAVTEATPPGTQAFRAQNDSSWLRYQYYATGDFWWRALSPDGTVYYFGHKDNHTSGCTIVSAGHAPVTRVEDAFSNQIDFFYEPGVAGECRIKAIVWGHNPIAGLNAFAGMSFTYATAPIATCNGVAIGSQTSYRTGTKIVAGASQLDKIESFAFPPSSYVPGQIHAPAPTSWEHKRTFTLGYSSATASCTAAHAPFRALASIQESAVGTDSPQVDLPAITFGYGDASVNYGAIHSPAVPWSTSGATWTKYNLGWGYRPPSTDAWPTVEAMMLDLDADGLVDRIVSEPIVDGLGRTTRCRARWYRNRGPAFAGPSQFASAGYIDMPTLKWATDVGLPPYNGGAHAGDNPSTGTNERCSLNYQRSGYRNSSPSFLTTCPPGNQTCPQQQGTNPPKGWCTSTKSDCGIKVNNQGDTHFAWRWMDMDGDQKPDLVGSPVTGGVVSYDLQWGNQLGAPQEPSIFGAFPACPASPYTADPGNWQFAPYTMCGGMFPWLIYKNHGNGVFGEAREGGSGATHGPLPTTNSRFGFRPGENGATHDTWGPLPTTNSRLPSENGATHDTWGPLPTQIIYQPIALETTNGESSVTSRPVGQYHGTIDIDGDGFVDAVRHDSSVWKVYRNDGYGLFTPAVGTTPFTFGTGGSSFFLSRTSYTPTLNPTPIGIEGLEDFNGDGLVDHWAGSGPAVNIFYNNGRLFQTPNSSAARPGPDGASSVLSSESKGRPSFYVCRGTRTDDRRTIDLDSDGRADLVINVDGNLGVRYNAGGQFTTSSTTSLGQGGGFHRFRVETDDSFNPCNSANGRWMTTQDFIDLNGDGVKEDVEFSTTGQMYQRPMTNTAPQRLLISINNQRGAITTIAYSSMNGAAVTQRPDLGKSSPTTGWVVQSVTAADSLANTNTTSTYAYQRPHVGADADATFPNRFAFRGFDEVHTTSATGAVTIERFSYATDWSGRRVSKIVKPSSGTNVHTIGDTSWEARTLVGGTIKTFHATAEDHWTCKNNQDEAACRANTDTRTHTKTTLTALSSTSTSDPTLLLWQGTVTRLGASPTAADGDRETATTYALFSDASAYRLRPRKTTQKHQVSGSLSLFAQSETGWDASYRVAETDTVWFDATGDLVTCQIASTSCATTRREFDLTMGNELRSRKPVQHATSGPAREFTYDTRKLFVATEVNELGHRTDSTYEYGTGTKLLSEGPNQRTCTLGQPGCLVDALHPEKEQHRIRVDGLGRMIERWETVSADGSVFNLTQAETNTYVDTATATVPTSKTNYLRVDEDASVWRQEKTEIDGHGRPIKTTLYAQGTAPADHVTRYTYRVTDGTLDKVRVPDPTQNNATLVDYNYTFDSLGRATSIRRPDDPADLSGVDMIYDGLTTTTREDVGSGGGQIAETQTINDRFGRLSQVKEKTGTSTFATTTYSYGPDDQVSQIVDPQGVTTNLTHDFAGRRTQIARATRTWKYGYDRNGNMTSEQAPGSSGPLTDVDFTTSTAYDHLDRELSKVIGKRTLRAADRALFVSGTEIFTYDVGYIGTLHYWRAYGPSGSNTEYGIDTYHDGQGRQTITQQSHGFGGYPALTRTWMQGYYISGALKYGRSLDFMGGTNETVWQYRYDARNLPSKVEMITPQALNIGVQIRNVAGLVTKRRTDLTGNPMTFVESNWTYDKLGRVTNQTVQRNISPAQIVRQQLTYFGNDDVKTLQHHLGATSRTFTFAYDGRHQITGVATNPSTYFGATYQYGNAGRLTRTTHTRTISPTPAGADPRLVRNVNYNYAGTDPEQVTSLTNVSGGAAYASYTYDAAGNQLTRSYPATSELFEYTYDGKDQLRRVVRKLSGAITGSEEYWYDTAGQRMAVIKRNASRTKTEMVWFIGDVQAHYDGAGTITKIYSNLSLGTPIARVERTSNTATTTEFQFHGLASNTIAAVAQNGTINASFSYAPFGERLESTDAGGASQGVAVHKRRSNDKYEDDIGALAYYGVRYYDKTLIAWTQGDPLFRFVPDAAWTSPRKANLYAFSLNNSLRYIDPDGQAVIVLVPLLVELAKDTALAVVAIYSAVTGGMALGDALAQAPILTLNHQLDYQIAQQVQQAREAERLENANINQLNNDNADANAAPENADSNVGKAVAKDDAPPIVDVGYDRVGVHGQEDIYVVPGERTSSGKEYVGRTGQAGGPEARGKYAKDGRDRRNSDAVDRVSKGRAPGAEQKNIDRRGGKKNLDNKRNEVGDKRRPKFDLPKDPNKQ